MKRKEKKKKKKTIKSKNQNKIMIKKMKKKKILNQSKSQNDINPDFIKKNLENKKNEEPSQNLKPSEPAVKKLLRMESICKKGFAGPGVKKTNQDNFFIHKNFLDSPDNIFLGVCDGHGMFGQDISGYLVNHLPQNLNNALLKENLKIISSQKDFPQISNAISLTFVQTNINLVNDEKVDSTFSGTTCSSLLFCPEKIITANVGDSRCVLGKFDGKNWKAKNLTRDHKPNEEDEKKRITEKGGRIEAYKDDDGDFVGPERVWLKEENIPGLAMSRSFGDEVAHTVGVVSQPEIFEYNFLNEDKFILLASDGIWEFISSDECVNIVKDYYLKDDIDGALNYLYKESSKRWIMEEEVIDDITLIIMFLS
jgi:serine/threonine protein phosphatase PrpC